MSLSSSQLDAFHRVTRARSFTKAAQELRLTQSALTQRLKNLEEELGVSLLVRGPRGVRPTPAGERLLRYCQVRSALEDELRRDIAATDDGELAGPLRIAAYSTVLRSVVLPALAPLVRAEPRIALELSVAELRDLPGYLLRAAADYILLDVPFDRPDVTSLRLGAEELVVVESRAHETPADSYLDHDPEDRTTASFLRAQKTPPPRYRRAFLDEIHTILDGVAEGLGRAVVPRHLAAGDARLRIVPGFEPQAVPVYLCFPSQPVPTRLHEAVVLALEARAPALLGAVKGRAGSAKRRRS